MILKSLTLKNYRKFRNAIVDFPDGVIGVVGLNGAGKSTIFESIAWVLYGPVAARTSTDQIKYNGAKNKDPCRVELEFIFEEDSYRIVREMTGKHLTASATITVNGKIAASGAEVVNKYIQKKLGMDFKAFYTSIFAKQKELNTLSSMNASERRPLILKMLGINQLDDVIKEVRSDKREKDLLIDRFNLDLIDKTGRNKTEIYHEKINDLEDKKTKINLKIKKDKEKIIITKAEVEKLEKTVFNQKKEYEKLCRNRDEQSEKKTLFQNWKKFEDELINLKNLTKERKKSLEIHSKKLKDYQKIESDVEKVGEKLVKISEIIKDFVKKIEQKKTIIDSIKKEIYEFELKKERIIKMGPNSTCPTCERVLGDHHDILMKNFKDEIKQRTKKLDIFLKDIRNIEDKYERKSREEQALQKRNNYLITQLREKERINTTINNILNEIKREKNDIEKKEKQIIQIGKIDFNEKKFVELKKQIETFYKKYQSSLEDFNEKKDQLNSIKINMQKNEGEEKLIMQNIKNLEEKIKELKEYKKRIDFEKKHIRNLNTLIEILSSFRTNLISRIRPTLSKYASDFFERLTNGKYNEIELDEDYNLMVYDEGTSYNVERFSGGEEDLANLCLRLSISELITERSGGIFNFIILDEIFGSQDMIRRQNIMKALNSLSSKFRQIFLITHVDDVKNYMENIVYVNENETGTSTVKIE